MGPLCSASRIPSAPPRQFAHSPAVAIIWGMGKTSRLVPKHLATETVGQVHMLAPAVDGEQRTDKQAEEGTRRVEDAMAGDTKTTGRVCISVSVL
jgi:hypothetical protein